MLEPPFKKRVDVALATLEFLKESIGDYFKENDVKKKDVIVKMIDNVLGNLIENECPKKEVVD